MASAWENCVRPGLKVMVIGRQEFAIEEGAERVVVLAAGFFS